MPIAEPEWKNVPSAIRPHLREYAELIDRLAAGRAESLTCFGAVTAGGFDPEHDAAANVLILRQTALDLLDDLARHGPELGRRGIAAPWVMTPETLRGSCDTFPLELLEIQQNHLTLLGNDLFAELTFADEHIRLQCERELKGALLQLQHGLLAAAGSERQLDRLARGIGTELVRTMRGLLWLRGTREALPAVSVIERVETHFGRQLPGVRAACDRYAHAKKQTFVDLYHDVEALGEIADAA